MNTKAYCILLADSFDSKKVVLVLESSLHSESHF